MSSISTMPASSPKIDDLPIDFSLNRSQFSRIETDLNMATIAILAISQIDAPGLMQIVRDLQLETSEISDWMVSWVASKSPPRKRLDLEQIRAVVIAIAHLAGENQAKIRQNISNWQQTIRYNQLPLQSPALADYIGNFITIYQAQIGTQAHQSFETISETALNLLVDLLFYSSPNGHRRLWGALLQKARSV